MAALLLSDFSDGTIIRVRFEDDSTTIFLIIKGQAWRVQTGNKVYPHIKDQVVRILNHQFTTKVEWEVLDFWPDTVA